MLRRRTAITAALAAVALGGCGFKLRSSQTFAFETLAVTPERNGLVAADLIRYFGKAIVPIAPVRGSESPQVIVDILQEVRDKNGRVSRQSFGTFIIARPGKFRFVYEKPYKQTIVSDGTTVWLHDDDLNQVTIKKLGDTVTEQPLALLLDASAADKLFDLKSAESQGSIGFVEAKSKKADAAFSDLRVAIVALQPRELTWRDALQNTNTIRFESLNKNGKLAAEAFRLRRPRARMCSNSSRSSLQIRPPAQSGAQCLSVAETRF